MCAMIRLSLSIKANEVITIKLNYVEGMKSYILLLGIKRYSNLEFV